MMAASAGIDSFQTEFGELVDDADPTRLGPVPSFNKPSTSIAMAATELNFSGERLRPCGAVPSQDLGFAPMPNPAPSPSPTRSTLLVTSVHPAFVAARPSFRAVSFVRPRRAKWADRAYWFAVSLTVGLLAAVLGAIAAEIIGRAIEALPLIAGAMG